MRHQAALTQLLSAAGGTQPSTPQPQPTPPAGGGSGGRPLLLHLAFLCLVVSMAAAWFVEPFVAAAEFRLPPSAVAVTLLLLVACFHAMIHLVHSFAAPAALPHARLCLRCRCGESCRDDRRRRRGWGRVVSSRRLWRSPRGHEYKSAYS